MAPKEVTASVYVRFRIPEIFSHLFEPLGKVILCVKVVHDQTDPARDEDEDDADGFSDKGDGLLEDVKNGED